MKNNRVRIFKNMSGNIQGGNFLGGNFPDGKFPGGESFPDTLKFLVLEQIRNN